MSHLVVGLWSLMGLIRIAGRTSSFLDWVAFGLVVWFVIAALFAIILAASIRNAERRETRKQGVPNTLPTLFEGDDRVMPGDRGAQ